MTDIEKVIQLFEQNVKGRCEELGQAASNHDGTKGHWLEEKMGIRRNSNNKHDILGYEMKSHTNSKTSFGDWSANYYIYRDGKYPLQTRTAFLRTFGKPNKNKNNRHSWSGEPVPKIHIFNNFGQRLIIDNANNIHAKYSFSEDLRENKMSLIPEALKTENLSIAVWEADSIKLKLERKFNQNGWFKCYKTKGLYSHISFGAPINYSTWIKFVSVGDIYFDSGMYEGNPKPYSHWRASNSFWEKLIIDTY